LPQVSFSFLLLFMKELESFRQRTFSSLSVPNYKKYFIGQIISSSGTWMQNIAQGLLVLKLTGSGTALGIVIALQFLPLLIFGSFAGVIADRFSKRRIFFITQCAFVVIATLFGLFALFNSKNILILYFLALCFGFVMAIDNPTKQSFIFELVGKDQIKNAISLNAVLVNIAKVIGPAIAALLVPIVGLAMCFFINAFSFISVLFVLWRIDPGQLHTGKRLTQVKGELSKGLSYALGSPVIKNVLFMMVIIGTFTFEFQVILPLFAQFTFHDSKTGYALLMTAMGIGAVGGGLYSASRKHVSMGSIMRVAFLFGCFMLIAAIMPNIFLAAIIMIAVGFFSINFNALSNTILQISSTPQMRGRIISLWSIAFLGTTPIGGPIIGWIGEHYGPRWGLAVGGCAALVAVTVVYFLKRRNSSELKIVPNTISKVDIPL
jgi:MFS family permease